MTEKTTLVPTAALVIDLAKKFYSQDKLTAEFLKFLDLSSGQGMIEEHKKAGIYELTQELICNRKFIIRHCVLEAVRSYSQKAQVVILAAGKAPLALELLSREFKRIERIYEVDIAPLAEKERIYKNLAPELCSKIVFHQGDIRSQKLFAELTKRGFNPDLYTIIVLEGITHYLSGEELEQLLGLVTSNNGNNHRVIIDFGPPYATLAERIQPVARQAYKIIEDMCYLQPMTKHTAQGLTAVFKKLGGNVLHHYTIHDIEKLRTAGNEFFPEEKSGWLEYMVAHV